MLQSLKTCCDLGRSSSVFRDIMRFSLFVYSTDMVIVCHMFEGDYMNRYLKDGAFSTQKLRRQ